MPRVCNISFKTFHDYYQEFITAQYSELLLTPTHTNTGLVLQVAVNNAKPKCNLLLTSRLAINTLLKEADLIVSLLKTCN